MKPIERWQLAILTAAVIATLSIRLVFGPFSLQGIIYLGVTAIAAAQFGPTAAAVSTVLGLIAAHVRIIIDRPSILSDPATMFTQQYISTIGIYLTLSAILYVASKRHYRLVGQLEREREDREQLDSAYKRELEASLIRETVARREAEQAGRAKEVLLEQIASELRLARELAAIVESSDDAIVAKDLGGVVTSWNRAADQTFGHTAVEMIGRSIRRIVPDERVAEEDNVLIRVQRGEKIVQFETVRQRKDGTLIPISLTASPIHDESGRVVGVSEIARNITDRKRAESALADLQQRLLALVSASGVLLRSPQVADVVPATLTVARDLVTADGYAIWRRERDTNRWRIMSSAGISETFARESAWHGYADDRRGAGRRGRAFAAAAEQSPGRVPGGGCRVDPHDPAGHRRTEHRESGVLLPHAPFVHRCRSAGGACARQPGGDRAHDRRTVRRAAAEPRRI